MTGSGINSNFNNGSFLTDKLLEAKNKGTISETQFNKVQETTQKAAADGKISRQEFMNIAKEAGINVQDSNFMAKIESTFGKGENITLNTKQTNEALPKLKSAIDQMLGSEVKFDVEAQKKNAQGQGDFFNGTVAEQKPKFDVEAQKKNANAQGNFFNGMVAEQKPKFDVEAQKKNAKAQGDFFNGTVAEQKPKFDIEAQKKNAKAQGEFFQGVPKEEPKAPNIGAAPKSTENWENKLKGSVEDLIQKGDKTEAFKLLVRIRDKDPQMFEKLRDSSPQIKSLVNEVAEIARKSKSEETHIKTETCQISSKEINDKALEIMKKSPDLKLVDAKKQAAIEIYSQQNGIDPSKVKLKSGDDDLYLPSKLTDLKFEVKIK